MTTMCNSQFIVPSSTKYKYIYDQWDFILLIIGLISFVLAYFYSLWPFWFIVCYLVLKNTLFWIIEIAGVQGAQLTMSQDFRLSQFMSNKREFWKALESALRQIHFYLFPNSPPPPPVLSRNNTMLDKDYIISSSLGRIHTTEYNNIRNNNKNNIILCIVIGTVIAVSIFYLW